MDLLKLNNEISGMRPFARQSSVNVIHFLTRKAGELLKRKGTDDKKAKLKTKAEKLMQEALIDKVLVPDEIVKFALQFDASLRDKVLNDISIPLSAKAFARLASHPSLAEKVSAFREKYPDWNKWLDKSLEKLGTGSRFGAKMKNGRVKAHLQQRQRVEEAVDTIRRAQMTWVHQSEKNKDKLEGKTKEIQEDSLTENVDAGDKEERNNLEYKKAKLKIEEKHNSKFKDSSDTGTTGDSSPKPALSKKHKTSKDCNKSKKDDRENLTYSNQKLKTVIYEEVDENESGTDEDFDNNDTERQNTAAEERKNKCMANKKSLNRKPVQAETGVDMSSESDEDSENSSANEQGNSTDNDESENMGDDNELEGTDDDGRSESQDVSENDDEIDEKTKKKLSKKEKRKEKAIIPRSREVEVCKFSDLIKKELTRRDNDDPSDSDDGHKPSQSPEKGVDPFFMTRNNDFLRIATAKKEAKQEEPLRAGPKWGIEGSENWTGTRRERRARARRLMGVPDPEGFSGRRGSSKFKLPSFPARRENPREGQSLPPVHNLPAVPNVPEVLHPSWAAKRKLNIASVGFQGKKVKFEDSD